MGIFGGGQLGMLLGEAFHTLSARFAVFAQDESDPAVRFADKKVVGDFYDERNIVEFIRLAPRALVEWEGVPSVVLEYAAQCGQYVSPLPSFLRIAQDRSFEKQLACTLQIPTVPYRFIKELGCRKCRGNRAQYNYALPGILKTCLGGYDGKSQVRVANFDELVAAFESFKRVPCVLEKAATIKKEYSRIVIRGRQGEVVFFPPIENEHRDGILVRSVYRQDVDPDIDFWTRAYTLRLLKETAGPIILAAEYFVVEDEKGKDVVLFNEMAPRPHNSGHLTREAFACSQFEYAARAALGLPLPPIEPLCREAEMINLIGDEVCRADELQEEGWDVALYGKKEVRTGRKMGHAVRCFQEARS